MANSLNKTVLRTVLLGRLEDPMSFIGIDTNSVVDVDAFILPQCATALLKLGYAVGSITALVDNDLNQVVEKDVLDVIDLSEYFILRALANRISDVDERLGPHSIWGSQYPNRIAKNVQTLYRELTDRGLLNESYLEFDKLVIRNEDPE